MKININLEDKTSNLISMNVSLPNGTTIEVPSGNLPHRLLHSFLLEHLTEIGVASKSHKNPTQFKIN